MGILASSLNGVAATLFTCRIVVVLLVQVCAEYCRGRSSSYKHYATQYGRECWCQDESIELRHGAGTCDFQCSGDFSIVCGGFDSFSLYELVERELPSPPAADNYVGCFADDRNDRVLGAKSSSSEMTSEVIRYRKEASHRFWRRKTYCVISASQVFCQSAHTPLCHMKGTTPSPRDCHHRRPAHAAPFSRAAGAELQRGRMHKPRQSAVFP